MIENYPDSSHNFLISCHIYRFINKRNFLREKNETFKKLSYVL